MISKVLNKLTNMGLELPADFKAFMERNGSKTLDYAFSEIKADGRTLVFNNFLGDTGNKDTDLYEHYKFEGDDDWLTFGNGAYGESFKIKVKGDNLGEIYVFFDDEGDKEKICLAKSFSDFMAKLKKKK